MDKTYYKSINETVHHTILENGLNVYIIKKEGYASKAAYFATKFGSFNTGDTVCLNDKEYKLIGGLAHFLEHRVFDYKDGNIIDLYYKLGADVNAYTSYDRTVYYFSTTNNFDECLKLLLDFPTSFTMSEEAVENEKDIIVNELLMYKDDPNDKLFKGLMANIYKNHPIRYDVGGEPSEVRETTRELLEIVHSTFYNPKNMYLVIVGDVDIEQIMKIIKQKEFKTSASHRIKNVMNEDLNVNRKYSEVYGDVNNEKLILGFKFKPLDCLNEQEKSKIFLSFDLLTSILFYPSSEFYKKMIEEKYVSFISVDVMEYEGMFMMLIETDILKSQQEIIDKIKEQLDNALNILTEEKLNNIKKKEIASVIKGSDSCMRLAKNFMTFVLDDMNYCTLIDLVKSMDIKDIEKAYKEYYLGSEYSCCVLRGKKDD